MNIVNFDALIDNYDVFLFDLWGVVHDGSQLYQNVMRIITKINESGKVLQFISNGPRRYTKIEPVLEAFGIKRQMYNGITSSGDTCYHSLQNSTQYGQKYFFMGSQKDWGLLNDLNYTEVTNIEDADFILNHGYFGDDRDNSIGKILEIAKNKQIQMLCVNPDITVIHKGNIIYCAGKIAEEYKKYAPVKYFGKPYAEIYELAINAINKPGKILAVGDSFYTDILGANNFGIHSCLVTQGIFNGQIGSHIEPNKANENFKNLTQKYNANPEYVIHNF